MTGLMGDRARSQKPGYWCFISVFLAQYLVETRFLGRTEWGDRLRGTLMVFLVELPAEPGPTLISRVQLLPRK